MAKTTKIETYLEFAGFQYPVSEVEKFVKNEIKKKDPNLKVEHIGVYLQPETDHVYYTVNGTGSPEYFFSFDELAH